MEKEVWSVSRYLDILNDVLGFAEVRIIGEVGQFTKRGNALYFSIRDKEESAVLNCFMWLSDYRLSGIEIEEGMEIIVSGLPEIYKPTGRLSLKAKTLEHVGEGELKKAYDALKKKLESEGFFDPELKKSLKAFPRKIGLITSREGAVIHDFLNNLARRGYQISFINSRVEGVRAVSDLLQALRCFKDKGLDALVVIRGGGSLESFIPFNNEMIIREMRKMPFPVLAGIGHDKDVPLFSLAADIMVSTPTAITALLNDSWSEADSLTALYEHKLLAFVKGLKRSLSDEFENAAVKIREYFERAIRNAENSVKIAESVIKNNNPLRQLKLGYSISRTDGKIIRSVKNIKKNQKILTEVSDGSFESEVI
jgi:exodeoxyribonuclease VII large subunit